LIRRLHRLASAKSRQASRNNPEDLVAANSNTLRIHTGDFTALIQPSLCLCESNDAFADCCAAAEGCHARVFMDK
jgi:hypothetical protein